MPALRTAILISSAANPPSRLRAILQNGLIVSGLIVLIVLGAAAALAPTLVKFGWLPDPITPNPAGLDSDGMPLPPGRQFPAGTDQLGRDVLSRVLHGTRVSLSVGLAGMLTASAVGVALGLLAGFHGGRLDLLLMRFTEIGMTLPAVLLAAAMAAVLDGRVIHFHPSGWNWHLLDFELKRGPLTLFLVIGFVCWPGLVRVVRAEVRALAQREFIVASKALGASDARLILRGILPSVTPTVIVVSVMLTGNTILLEAGLGYLGIGVPPPLASWGSMIQDGQPYFVAAPHIVIAPGLAIVTTVLAFNLIGQGLQEVWGTAKPDCKSR